jgi:hypothetical protein
MIRMNARLNKNSCFLGIVEFFTSKWNQASRVGPILTKILACPVKKVSIKWIVKKRDKIDCGS